MSTRQIADVTRRHMPSRRVRALVLSVIALSLAACGTSPRQSGVQGSRQTVRLQQPPNEAAACFARNAEEHSSALVAEIRARGSGAEVIVRVRNGVLYGTGDFQRAGSGSSAS